MLRTIPPRDEPYEPPYLLQRPGPWNSDESHQPVEAVITHAFHVFGKLTFVVARLGHPFFAEHWFTACQDGRLIATHGRLPGVVDELVPDDHPEVVRRRAVLDRDARLFLQRGNREYSGAPLAQ